MNRKSIYLNFINDKLKGSDIQFPNDLKPKTRVEEYLYGISQLLLGELYILPGDLKPKNKEELFLQWLYDSCIGISSGNGNSNKNGLELIDKVLVRIKPILKLKGLEEYYVFKYNNSLTNNLNTHDSVNIKKKGIIKLKDFYERFEYTKAKLDNTTNGSNVGNIRIQNPISLDLLERYTFDTVNLEYCINTDTISISFN